MASEREEALYAEEPKTFWTAMNLSGHFIGLSWVTNQRWAECYATQNTRPLTCTIECA